MRTSIGVGALSATGVVVAKQLLVAALGFGTVVLIVCGTVLLLSRMNGRPPRVDWGSFHLSFDGEKGDRNA